MSTDAASPARASVASSALDAIAPQRRTVLAQVVEARLRDAIMFGELKLGEAVSEDKLAARLGVSRTPVREALMALQHQGLMSIQPQKASIVFQPTSDEIAEICEFRALMECEGIALAMARAMQPTLSALRAAQAAMTKAEAAQDHLGAARADAAFHGALIEGAGSRLLAQAYMLVSGRVGAIRYAARRASTSRRRSGADHEAIIKAFAARDLAKAVAVLREHIMNMRVHFAEAEMGKARLDASPARA